ncbi:MAG: ATP synthase F1 subunit delta [Gemmatimonadota bacterium]
MRPATIAHNYAEAIFQLGEKSGQAELYAELLDAVAGAIEAEPTVQAVLMSPRVPKPAKSKLLASALPDAPREFILFLQAVVKRGRQGLFRLIASEYMGLLDIQMNRVRAGVTLAREADESMRHSIAEGLRVALKKEVIPTYRIDPEILGGVIVRVGDRVFDGSVRRSATRLRRQLLTH